MDKLQAMRVFLTLVDRGSLSSAASVLGLSLPTVSRILAKLERELGVRLIARTTRHRLTRAICVGTIAFISPTTCVRMTGVFRNKGARRR